MVARIIIIEIFSQIIDASSRSSILQQKRYSHLNNTLPSKLQPNLSTPTSIRPLQAQVQVGRTSPSSNPCQSQIHLSPIPGTPLDMVIHPSMATAEQDSFVQPFQGKQVVVSSSFVPYLRFSSLSNQQLRSATLIEDPTFVEYFLKNYPGHQTKVFHLPSSRSYKCPFSVQLETPVDLFSLVRVALTPEPHLYLQLGESTVKQLLLTLKEISGGKMFELPIRTFGREKVDQNLLWFSSASFHPLISWLASALQKAILSYYFTPKRRFDKIRSLNEYMAEKQASKICLDALQISLNRIDKGFFEEKDKLALSIRGYEEELRDHLHKKMLEVEDKKKKKRRRTNKDKKYHSKDKQKCGSNNPEQINEEKQKQPQQREEKSVKEPTTEEVQIVGIDSCNQMKESTSINSQTSLKEELRNQVVELDLTVCSKTELISDTTNIDLSPSVQCSKTSYNQKLQDERERTQEIKLDEDEFEEEKVKIKRNSSHQHIRSTNLSQEKEENDQEDTCTTSTKKKRKRKGQKSQNKIADDFRTKVTSIIMNKQLNSMLDDLSMQSNSSYDSKVVAFERVRYFSKCLYPQTQAILFGSNAVGLSLPSSDIDIMLVDLPSKSKDDICQCLAQIAIYINTMGWVTSCSTYFNAKVPLVKLQIDPSVGYYTPKSKNEYFCMSDPYRSCSLDLKDPSKGVPIKVDITISSEEGKTSGSTQLMRGWISNNSSLQRVLLALKYSLSLRGFSENFKGGVGSYCLFVMVAAFFKEFEEVREDSDCQILLDILKFYGQDFENQLKVVTLGEQQRCFIQNQEAKDSFELTDQILFNNLLKIIDPLNGKLMSSSCWQFNCIKTEWRRIRNDILKLEDLVQAEIESCFGNTAQMAKIMTSRKSLERWAYKAQSRIGFSISDIIKQQY